MIAMEKKCNFRKGIFAVLVAASAVVGCSKSNNDEPVAPSSPVETPAHLKDWTPQPKIAVAQPYMAFATGSTATTLSLTAVGSTAADVWVDTNNNGIFDEGVDKRITDFTKPVTFKVTDKVFAVYGKVKELTATGNALTAADVRKNEALTKLNVADNQLSEKALLNLVNSLPATTASGTTAVVLRKDTDDSNTVTEAVLIAAKQRGWQALKVEKGKEVPDLPADTQAPKAGAITEATATAFNSVLVKWTAATDNKTAAKKLRYQVLYNVKGSGEVKPSEVKENMLELTLTGLTEKTTYIVKVKVMDEAGNATDYEAKEVTTPAAPVTADTEAPKAGTITEATATAFNSVLVKWTAATDNKTVAEKLRYQVLYNVKGSSEVKTSEVKENMLALTLTGLTEKTTYVVKVKVMDEAGNTAEYQAKEVTTPAEPVTADTQAPKAGAITEATATFNTLNLKWTAATDNKTAAEKLRYQVLYNVKGSSEVKTSELKENMLALTLTGLTEKTTYVVKVKVMDEANNATDYEAKEVTTPAAPEAADTKAPKAGAITEATATAFNTLNLKWTAATDDKTVTGKLRYQVLYNVKGSSEVKTSELKENMLVLTLTGLTEKTTYVVKVKVMDEAGNTAEYQAKEVTTPAAPDTQAPTPAAISDRITVTDQTATLSWEAATDNKTSFEGLRYQVFWKVNGSAEVKNSGTPKAAFFSYTIEGLTPNTTYTVWVEVLDKAGNKAKYPEKTFTTAKKEEPKPEPKDTHYIVLTTQKAVGEKVKLNINAAEENQAGVWLDLNNNGKWDEGIDKKPTEFFRDIEYTLKAQTFRIYGKVWHLDCQNNQLMGLDISQNAALTRLLVQGNNLSSIAHLEHLKELSIDSHTLLASSLPKELTFLRVNETTPLTTINTSPFTELNSLDIDNCKNLKSLDLSNNKRLVTLYISNTGLTTLDLSHQPQLRNLYADLTPLTKLNVAGNKALKYVYIKLTQEGKGLQGEALMDFLKQLPTHEKGKEGRMYLRRTQATDAMKNYLASKFWKVDAR